MSAANKSPPQPAKRSLGSDIGLVWTVDSDQAERTHRVHPRSNQQWCWKILTPGGWIILGDELSRDLTDTSMRSVETSCWRSKPASRSTESKSSPSRLRECS